MKAKEYLERAYWLDQMIDSKLEQVASLRAMATKTTTIMKRDVVSRSRNMHSMEDTIAKITDLEEEINADIDRLVDMKKEIGETIRRVEDPRQRTVLEYRYLCYMRFTKIAEVLNYGESTIRVWHQKGLERLESFLNPDENLAENSGK